MPIANLRASNTTDVVKSEEGNDSLDTIIKQAIGKEPLLSYTRNGDSSVQWIQLLQALDQPELPGWPLLTPLKVQMQKCEKCSQEFCSTINYRRHTRVQHRLRKLNKDSIKNRELLGAFWDKLLVEEAKEIVSFKNLTLEEIPGSSILKSLTAVIRKPGFSSLPQVYLRAGSGLLDVLQARPSRFPISSLELFSILDDASEKTFLCGAAVSMQKYIFDGEVRKIGLETRNIVACTSFLVEQILIKAWLADKDAEALRCQKLLVEEEEAAQRRRAELLERRRKKKLRQKEQKAKELRHGEQAYLKDNVDGASEAVDPPESSSTLASSDSDPNNIDAHLDHTSSLGSFHLMNFYEYADYDILTGPSNGYTELGPGQNLERRVLQGNSRRHLAMSRHQVPPKLQRALPNGFHSSQLSQSQKLGGMQKNGINRDLRSSSISGNKVWSQKAKPENDTGILKTRVVVKEAINKPHQNKNQEVLIGSISVTLGNCKHHEDNSLAESRDGSLVDSQMPKKNNIQEKTKFDLIHGSNRSAVKVWRPVSRNGTKSSTPILNGSRESEADVIGEKIDDQTLCDENSLRSCAVEGYNGAIGSLVEFNSHAARAFLAERWKEAISAEHVKLVLLPEPRSSSCAEIQSDFHVEVIQSSDLQSCSVFGNAENRRVNALTLEPSTAAAAKAKFRTKPEKGAKIKYIPKQRIMTS